MSNKSFRERYKYWKETGELPYSNGLIKDLPENQSEGVPVKSSIPYPMLTSRDYDDARAYELGYFDEAGATGHLWSNDPETGRILKSPTHPTVGHAIWGDMNMGNDVLNKNGQYYSKPNFIKQKIDNLPGYDGGRDGFTIKYVNSYRVNPETGGVYDKVGDIKEGAVILDPVEVIGQKPEWMRMQEEAERMRNIQSRQGLSGADPIGQFAVEAAALNPVFKLLGTGALYGLGKYGEALTGFTQPQNWARAKLISRAMDKSPINNIGSPTLTPAIRTKLGDVEIDNPISTYDMNSNVRWLYHGRHTDRGPAFSALRNYSNRDVGLHLTENLETAKQFAGNDGIIYRGLDLYSTYPDAIYDDIVKWQAHDWDDLLRRSYSISPKSEQEELKRLSQNVVDGHYGKMKTVRDLVRHFNLDPKEIQNFASMSRSAQSSEELENANRLFAKYLAKHNVNFIYHNDFEGGGFEKPSLFISNPSRITWFPFKQN